MGRRSMHAGFTAVFPTHRICSRAGRRPQGYTAAFPQPGPHACGNVCSDAINQLCSALSPCFQMGYPLSRSVKYLLSDVMYEIMTGQ